MSFSWGTTDEAYGQLLICGTGSEPGMRLCVLSTKRNDTLTTTSVDKNRADELIDSTGASEISGPSCESPNPAEHQIGLDGRW